MSTYFSCSKLLSSIHLLKVNQQHKPKQRARDCRSHTALSKTKNMKKLTLLLFLIVFRFSASAQAPMGNPGFELVSPDSIPLLWGQLTSFAISIDSNGNPIDSLVFDGLLCGVTNDAHTGNYALELRNAYNFTTQTGYPGGACAMQDSNQFYSLLLDFSNIGNPDQLNFYYKFLAVGNDSGYAKITVFDSLFDQIAVTEIRLGANSTYSFVNVPITYNQAGSAIAAQLCFFNSTPLGSTNLGSRLNIDDVNITTTTGLQIPVISEGFHLVPNPANDIINIFSNEKSNQIQVFDMQGRAVFKSFDVENKIDCHNWKEGMYIVKIQSGQKTKNEKLVIKH